MSCKCTYELGEGGRGGNQNERDTDECVEQQKENINSCLKGFHSFSFLMFNKFEGKILLYVSDWDGVSGKMMFQLFFFVETQRVKL